MGSRRAIAILVVVAAAGCATPYQEKGYRGGYEDYRAGANAHFVRYTGNGYTGKGTILQYWHRRAAEICGGEGRYEVLSMGADSSQHTYGNSTTTYTGTSRQVGRSTYQTGTATTQQPVTVTKHEASGYIRCLGQPATATALAPGYDKVLEDQIGVLQAQRSYCSRLLKAIESQPPERRDNRLWQEVSPVVSDLGVLVNITTTWRGTPTAAVIKELSPDAVQTHKRVAGHLQSAGQMLGPDSDVGKWLREAADYHQQRAIQTRALSAQL